MTQHLVWLCHDILSFCQRKNLQESKITIRKSVDNKKSPHKNLEWNDDKQINVQTTNCGLFLCSDNDSISCHPFLGNIKDIYNISYEHKECHKR